MLSTSKLGAFCLSQTQPTDKLYKKHKFSSHMISPYDQYKTHLNSNTYDLKKKYPSVEVEYIKSLLEQLQNNVQMVTAIIQQDQNKQPRNLMEEERLESQSLALSQASKQKSQLSKTQDIRLLRNSLLKLYRKLSDQQKDKQQLARKVAVLSRQNQSLKLMNQQLMRQQIQQMDLMKNLDIC